MVATHCPLTRVLSLRECPYFHNGGHREVKLVCIDR